MERAEAIALAARAAMRLVDEGAGEMQDFDIHLSEIVAESSLVRAAFTEVVLHRDARANAAIMRVLEDKCWQRTMNVAVIGNMLLASFPYLTTINFDNPVQKEGLNS